MAGPAPRQAGFTLIEWLVVVVIIGILAALLLPQLLGARRTAVARAGQAHSANVYKVLSAALAEDKDKTVDDLLGLYGSSCLVASSGTPPFTWKAAPGGTTECKIEGDGATDFKVTVKMDGSGNGATFVNGAPQ